MVPRLAALLAAVALLPACGGKRGGPAPAGSSAAASSASSATPGIDPKIEALADAVLPCAVRATGFDTSCPGMKAWSEAKDDFAEGKADTSLVGLLASRDEKVRYLAAYKLNEYGKDFKTDRALAGAVLAAAERETSPFAAYQVGAAAGRIHVQATGTLPRLKKLLAPGELPEMRRGVLAALLYENPKDPDVFELVRSLVKDADEAVALAALSSFWTGGSGNADGTCQLYFENLENPNAELAAEASNALAWYGKCASRYDGLLDALEKRVKAGPSSLDSPSFVTAARHVCEDAKATDAQKRRGAAIGRAVAKDARDKAWVRASALETVMKCDASAAGRAFVDGFRKDPEKSVADKARALVPKK